MEANKINNKFIQAINEAYEEVSLSTLSPLMQGRDQLKISAHELNKTELSIISVDYIEYSKKEKDIEHCVVVFKEYPNHFYFGGYKLSQWVKGVLEKVDLEEFNTYLLSNPVKVKFDIIKTSNGNSMLDFSLVF